MSVESAAPVLQAFAAQSTATAGAVLSSAELQRHTRRRRRLPLRSHRQRRRRIVVPLAGLVVQGFAAQNGGGVARDLYIVILEVVELS